MKKTAITFALSCGLFLLASCSSNSPKGVFEQNMKYEASGNIEKCAELYFIDGDDAEKQEKYKADLIEMMKQGLEMRKKEGDKLTVKDYEILKEELSESGNYAKITYRQTLGDGSEQEQRTYLAKDKEGQWKILIFGSDKLLRK